MNYERVADTAATVADATGRATHDVALVLGSGLSDYAESLPSAVSIPYSDLPGLPQPKVEGHAGTLVSSGLETGNALVFAGRVHLYEGWDLDDLVFGVRVAIAAGCGVVVLTNAAGGIGSQLAPGDLVLISDHLNLAGRNPLIGANDDRLGPRFPDMTDVYSPELRQLAKEAGREVGVDLTEGVYAWLTGPSYETPAEIRMIRSMGGDLVGMSTVPEAIAARHQGSQVLGISLVTNLAAGLSGAPLSHEEVQETADAARGPFAKLLDSLLPRLIAA